MATLWPYRAGTISLTSAINDRLNLPVSSHSIVRRSTAQVATPTNTCELASFHCAPSRLDCFVNMKNKKLALDIERGMEKAIADGSFDRLFQHHWGTPWAKRVRTSGPSSRCAIRCSRLKRQMRESSFRTSRTPIAKGRIVGSSGLGSAAVSGTMPDQA